MNKMIISKIDEALERCQVNTTYDVEDSGIGGYDYCGSGEFNSNQYVEGLVELKFDLTYIQLDEMFETDFSVQYLWQWVLEHVEPYGENQTMISHSIVDNVIKIEYQACLS